MQTLDRVPRTLHRPIHHVQSRRVAPPAEAEAEEVEVALRAEKWAEQLVPV